MPTDTQQVLTALLHDLRSPLGVAHGYLRLVREGRLPTDADRVRALDKTRDALGRMTQMCDDATSAAARAIENEPSGLSVQAFVDAVRAHLGGDDFEVVSGDMATTAIVRLQSEPGRLVAAVVDILKTSLHARRDAVVRAETRVDTLSFLRHHRHAVTDDIVVVSLPLETQSA